MNIRVSCNKGFHSVYAGISNGGMVKKPKLKRLHMLLREDVQL